MGHLLTARIERYVREHDLVAPHGGVTCLVSGGADSTCLWHALRALGYGVTAVHVDHGLRGGESDADARYCREVMGAEIVRVPPGKTEQALRDLRYSRTERFGLRATGHTASDQVETVLYRLVSSGSTRGIRRRRADRVVRPLLGVWRPETESYCRDHGLAYRCDSSNPSTARGLIRSDVLPLLRRLHPGADANLLALGEREPRLPRALEASLVELLGSHAGTKSADLGEGRRAVREYDELRLEGTVTWGPWRLATDRAGLSVRSRRPGDRLAGRRRKLQDVFVDAKVPRADRGSWPVVVRGDQVVSVPGLAAAPGWEEAVEWSVAPRSPSTTRDDVGVGE
jgi:tRNA(Ile)-lysidine synthetase-like protein